MASNTKRRIAQAIRWPRMQAASYEAATNGRNYDNYYSYALETSANAELTSSVRKTIRNRARYELRNNCYARGIVDTKSNYVIGTGPRLQVVIDDPGAASAIEFYWRAWSRSIALDEILRQALVARYGDSGEVFVVMTSSGKGIIPLLPVLVECDRVFAPYDRQDTDDGIIYDKLGVPTEYLICDVHPGDSTGVPRTFTPYPASDVCHIYRQIRPGQRRGIPDITPALPLFGNLRRFSMATLGAAEMAADFAAVLYSDMSAQDQEQNPIPPELVDPFSTYDIERNQAMTLPYGWKIQQFEAKHPNAQYWDFVRASINEAARCLEMPVAIALMNSERLNYASGRLDHQAFVRSIDIERQRIGNQMLYGLVDRFFSYARLLEPQLVKYDSMPPYEVVWDGFEHVDPTKEAQAAQLKIQNNMMTLAQYYAKEGLDWEEQLRQRAKERDLEDELGLSTAPMVEEYIEEPEQPQDVEDEDEQQQ